MDIERKYAFHWGLLGNIATGRPNLGYWTRLEVYRLMQFTFRDVLEQRLGSKEVDRIFYKAGWMAGSAFYHHLIHPAESFEQFFQKAQKHFADMKIGILRVENSDPVNGHMILTVSEDLDCSGLPELDDEICTYDEGFLAGLLESYTGVAYDVKEIDCWCTGDRTCRFDARIRGGESHEDFG